LTQLVIRKPRPHGTAAAASSADQALGSGPQASSRSWSAWPSRCSRSAAAPGLTGKRPDGRAWPPERTLRPSAPTSAVLGEVTAELRLAAKNAAAVTSEQSSAVAETSATIEELATTAGLIADKAHAVAKAAEQTGDTMRDMQEKVEAIAARALSLGERAQKIGEILELINDIAGRRTYSP
jgi:hypothetical protein